MKKLQCELCNGTDFTKDGEYFVCDYCRAKYSTQQAQKMIVEGTVQVAGTVQVDRRSEATNLIVLAKSALEAGNPAEAYDYSNRALEVDANNWEAWACKGKAAGWSSTLATLRISEMLHALRTAHRLAPEPEKDHLQQEWAVELNNVATAIHRISVKHVGEHLKVDGTFQAHVDRCEQLLVLLDAAYEWGRQPLALRNKIDIALDALNNRVYKDHKGSLKIAMAQPAQRQRLQAVKDQALQELLQLDPSAVPPKAAGSCFVVTATMGNESSFPVVTLREFRDEVLAGSGAGRRFIRWYAQNGPRLASLIERSRVLRAVALTCVVAPSTAAAWLAMRARRMWR